MHKYMNKAASITGKRCLNNRFVIIIFSRELIMKPSKAALLFASSTLLVGCTMKSITPEEAASICQEIVSKLYNEELTLPTKVIVENYELYKNPNGTKNDHKAKFSLDLDNETFHIEEQYTRTIGDTTFLSTIEEWSWKDGDKYYYATTDVEGSRWGYINGLGCSNYTMEQEVYFSFSITSSLANLSSEQLKEDYLEDVKWSLKSSGEGSLLFEISGIDEGDEFKGRINIKNNFLEEYYIENSSFTSHYKQAWGKSSFRKPNLKNFEFVENL